MHDYVIIGSGPTGLTLAWYLAKNNKKILIIEKELSIGGCHRVRRVEHNGINYFTEHGPRIYIDNYYHLIDLLKSMHVNFNELFTPYDFTVNISIQQIISQLSTREILAIVYEFMIYAINENASKKIPLVDFLREYNFSRQSIKTIDRICRLTDGGTIDNYTLFEFFEVFNQNFFYNIYQPKKPNDIGLFKIWMDNLVNTGNVSILFNTNITEIIYDKNNNISAITDGKTEYIAKKYIFAIPPEPFITILNNSTNKNIFGDISKLKELSEYSKYLTYIPVIFHWHEKLKLKKVWGSTDTDWGIAFIVLSDYMTFTESKTVIVATVTLSDSISSYTNKTANQSSEPELINEVLNQLKIYHELSIPNVSILSPGIYRKNNKWETHDTAFILTKYGHMPKTQYKNVYWIGTHSGLSNYNFTSMESAMENAVMLLSRIEPSIEIPKHRIITVKMIIAIVAVIIIYIYIYKYYDGTSIDTI